jgi:AAA15 family ATPase/GTPase
VADLAKQAQIAPNLEVWLRSPASSDFPGVDVKLSTNPVERKKQAEDLAKIATEKKLEVEVREPKNEKPIRRFRILKKEEAEKLKEQKQKSKAETIEKPQKELKQKEDDNSPLIEGHKMPSKAEILEKAQQLYMADNGRFQDLVGTNLPEESELREEGYLKRAQIELMTSTDTKATRQVMDYVGTLKNDLEQIGFTIVPIEGFNP